MAADSSYKAGMEWPEPTDLVGVASLLLLAVVASITLGTMAYLSFDGFSPGAILLLTLVPAVVMHLGGARFSEVFGIVRRASDEVAMPATFDGVLRLTAPHLWTVYVWLAIIYLPLVVIFVARPDIIAFMLFLSACSSILIEWLCRVRGVSAAPLPLGFLLGLYEKTKVFLSRKFRNEVAANMLIFFALYMVFFAGGRYLAALMDLVLPLGLAPLLLVLLIHPVAVPFVWVSIGAEPVSGLVLLLVSVALQIPPVTAFVRAYYQPLSPATQVESQETEMAADSESDFDLIAHVREISAPQASEPGQVWTPELFETHWRRSKYPPYQCQPTAETGLLRTFGDWSIGFAPNSTPCEKFLRGMVLPFLLIIIFLVFSLMSELLREKGDMSVSTLSPVILMGIVVYILNQYSVVERVAMVLTHQGYPIRLSAIDRWMRHSLRMPGWIIDAVSVLAVVLLTGYSLVAGVLMLVFLRLSREVLRLHVLHNTWIRGNSPSEAPTLTQVICVAYLVAQIIWCTIFSVAYGFADESSRAYTLLDAVYFWFIALFLPMLGHWLLIRTFLVRQVGGRLDRAVI